MLSIKQNNSKLEQKALASTKINETSVDYMGNTSNHGNYGAQRGQTREAGEINPKIIKEKVTTKPPHNKEEVQIHHLCPHQTP